jgi:hypothetical protein
MEAMSLEVIVLKYNNYAIKINDEKRARPQKQVFLILKSAIVFIHPFIYKSNIRNIMTSLINLMTYV